MIRINLLPHREAKRKQKQKAFIAMLMLGGLVGAFIVMLVGGYNARQISVQEARNALLTQASADLDVKIAEITTLKDDIAALQARQQAVEDVQGDRNQPVHLLDQLVHQTPDGVHLKTIKQDGQRVILTGNAQSQERVAELLRNLATNSPWLERPDLTEVKAATVTSGKGANAAANARKVVEFTLAVSIKRNRDGEEAGTAAAGAPGTTARVARTE